MTESLIQKIENLLGHKPISGLGCHYDDGVHACIDIIRQHEADTMGEPETARTGESVGSSPTYPASPSEIPVNVKLFGERLHPEISKAFDEWVEYASNNPLILSNIAFETFLGGWQAHEAATKRESVVQPKKSSPEEQKELAEARGAIMAGVPDYLKKEH